MPALWRAPSIAARSGAGRVGLGKVMRLSASKSRSRSLRPGSSRLVSGPLPDFRGPRIAAPSPRTKPLRSRSRRPASVRRSPPGSESKPTKTSSEMASYPSVRTTPVEWSDRIQLKAVADRVCAGRAGIGNHLAGRGNATRFLGVHELAFAGCNSRSATARSRDEWPFDLQPAIILLAESHPAAVGGGHVRQFRPEIAGLGEGFFECQDHHPGNAIEAVPVWGVNWLASASGPLPAWPGGLAPATIHREGGHRRPAQSFASRSAPSPFYPGRGRAGSQRPGADHGDAGALFWLAGRRGRIRHFGGLTRASRL